MYVTPILTIFLQFRDTVNESSGKRPKMIKISHTVEMIHSQTNYGIPKYSIFQIKHLNQSGHKRYRHRLDMEGGGDKRPPVGK